MKKFIPFLLLIAALISCKQTGYEQSVSTGAAPDPAAADNLKTDSRKLIKDGSLRFRTDNNPETYHLVTQAVKQYGAYISEENTFNYSDQSGFELTVRVPAEQFDSLMNDIVDHASIKQLDSKSTAIRDVTTEFIDIQARLNVKKESELKLIELLRNSKNLAETLAIQKQLTDLRADIESVEGQLKYLTNQVEYSTLRISFYETIKYSRRFVADFWSALKDGWQVFLHGLTLLAYLWVVILFVLVGRFGYRYYRRHLRKAD